MLTSSYYVVLTADETRRPDVKDRCDSSPSSPRDGQDLPMNWMNLWSVSGYSRDSATDGHWHGCLTFDVSPPLSSVRPVT